MCGLVYKVPDPTLAGARERIGNGFGAGPARGRAPGGDTNAARRSLPAQRGERRIGVEPALAVARRGQIGALDHRRIDRARIAAPAPKSSVAAATTSDSSLVSGHAAELR